MEVRVVRLRFVVPTAGSSDMGEVTFRPTTVFPKFVEIRRTHRHSLFLPHLSGHHRSVGVLLQLCDVGGCPSTNSDPLNGTRFPRRLQTYNPDLQLEKEGLTNSKLLLCFLPFP